jgi:hypothetical protein
MNAPTVTKPTPVRLWGDFTQRPQPQTLSEEFAAIIADARAEAKAVVAACAKRSKLQARNRA